MPIDPRIALGVQPLQLQSPINMMAQMQALQNAHQENAMRQAQMANYESEVKRRNALLPAELAKAASEQKTAELGRDSAFNKLVGERMETSRRLLETVTTPEAYIAWHEANHTDPVLGQYLKQRGVTAEQARAGIVAALQKPGGFDELLRNSRLGLERSMENHFQTQDYGGGERIVAMPKYGTGAARVVEGSDIRKTLSPADAAREAREPGDDRTKVASTTTDNAGNVHHWNKFGEEINAGAGVGKGKPSATFEKTQAQQKQLKLDLDSTISELEKATAKGGLIEKATGSGAGAMVDATAGFFGNATEGSIAIGSLKPIYDKVLKMVPRFEGPQSDKDTASYNDAAGNLANPNTPKATKLAAAKEILRLMKERKAQFVTRDMAESGAVSTDSGWQDL